MFYKFATKSITHSSEMWVMVSDLVAGPLNSPKAKLDAKISHRGVLAEPAHGFKAFTVTKCLRSIRRLAEVWKMARREAAAKH